MITQLRFKNWRSLKDVTISDLRRINVFIGANSSGKTNILDALHFWRFGANIGLVEAVLKWGGQRKIQTMGINEDEPIEFEISFLPFPESLSLTELSTLQFSGRDFPFIYSRTLREGTTIIDEIKDMELPPQRGMGSVTTFAANEAYYRARSLTKYFQVFEQRRWQLLGENFVPPPAFPGNNGVGQLSMVDPSGNNLDDILEVMEQAYPGLYKKLVDDLQWVLDHVASLGVEFDEGKKQIFVRDSRLGGRKSPNISAGTRHVIAMLTAFYALDIDATSFYENFQEIPLENRLTELNHSLSEMPGLVVIEEPDTALNPGLLRKFVGQLRTYVDGPNPRQIIMTTHNPSFLDYFEPEEVRVVSRNEQGYTEVERIPPYIKDIWLDKYGLGEVWTTNSFGGVPE